MARCSPCWATSDGTLAATVDGDPARLFAAVASIVISDCLDVEYPRLGLVRIGAADQALLDLRTSFGE